MKRVLFSLAFALFAIAGVSAQSCAKSCQAKQGSAASATCTKDNAAAAAKLASMDKTIETRTCPVTGSVSYVRKETDAKGTVQFVDVTYDGASNTFVNVAPSQMEGAKASCGSGAATATSGKPGCASSAGSGKACCAGKAKSASASATPTKTVEKGAAKGN